MPVNLPKPLLYASNSATYRPTLYGPIGTGTPIVDFTNPDWLKENINNEWARGLESATLLDGNKAKPVIQAMNTAFAVTSGYYKIMIQQSNPCLPFVEDGAYNENAYVHSENGTIFRSLIPDNNELLTNENAWQDTGKNIESYIFDDYKQNLVINGDFNVSTRNYNLNNNLDGVRIAFDYWHTNRRILEENYKIKSVERDGKKWKRIELDDADTTLSDVRITTIIDRKTTVALKGKQVTISTLLYLDENFTNTSNGRMRIRVGRTTNSALLQDKNLNSTDVTSAITNTLENVPFIAAFSLPENPSRNANLLLEGTFTVPENAVELVFMVESQVSNLSTALPVDKTALGGGADTFAWEITDFQLIEGTVKRTFTPNPRDLALAWETTEIKKRTRLTQVTSTLIAYSLGYFDLVNGGKASISAGTLAFSEITSPTANTLYYLFGIYNPETRESKLHIDISPTSPTLPSGFILGDERGAVTSNGAGDGFRTGTWTGNEFRYLINVASIVSTSITTAPQTIVVPIPPNTLWLGTVDINNSSGGGFTNMNYRGLNGNRHVFSIFTGGTYVIPLMLYAENSTIEYFGLTDFTMTIHNLATLGWKDPNIKL